MNDEFLYPVQTINHSENIISIYYFDVDTTIYIKDKKEKDCFLAAICNLGFDGCKDEIAIDYDKLTEYIHHWELKDPSRLIRENQKEILRIRNPWKKFVFPSGKLDEEIYIISTFEEDMNYYIEIKKSRGRKNTYYQLTKEELDIFKKCVIAKPL